VNGSFENASGPDLSGWEWTCAADSLQEAPLGGGDWCIKVFGGNFQGCYPGYAYQRLPDITDGQQVTLSGWVKTPSGYPVGLFAGTIQKGMITPLDGDTTSSGFWVPLIIQTTYSLEQGDTAVVLLYGGITSGPFQGYGYFDQIFLEETTPTADPFPGKSIRIFPNPFTNNTTIETNLPFEDATIEVYNSLGQQVRQVRHVFGNYFIFDRLQLSPGLYAAQIKDVVHHRSESLLMMVE
jgi:hypothetical protein